MEIAKALILAGRTAYDQPWPSVKSGPKHLVPVANTPILFHNLESLRNAGMLEATIAVEPDSRQAIMAAVGDGSAWNLVVRYVRWEPTSRIGGALRAGREFLADEPVLVAPADALHREQMHPHIAAFARGQADAMALTPTGAPCDRGGTPIPAGYLLSPTALSLLMHRPRLSGDPLAGIRRHGGVVLVQEIDGCLPCHGDQNALLDGNRRMLEGMRRDVDVALHPASEFQGPVKVHPTARIEHSLIRGPAVIGPGARLSHAYVGPYTSIGADVTIDGSQIEHSIVLDGAQLLHLSTRLETSVIGRGARVRRTFSVPSAMRLSIGDGADVTVS